jgi:hypothetical protein
MRQPVRMGIPVGRDRFVIPPAPRADVPEPELQVIPVPRTLGALPVAKRIALEMALNDDSERRAMDGDLAELEAAWREAEEIAAIADNMFLPAGITEWVRARERAK